MHLITKNDNAFLVVTREKTVIEAQQMFDWLDENYIQFSYIGNRSYWIEGKEDATLFKLFWS